MLLREGRMPKSVRPFVSLSLGFVFPSLSARFRFLPPLLSFSPSHYFSFPPPLRSFLPSASSTAQHTRKLTGLPCVYPSLPSFLWSGSVSVCVSYRLAA